MSKTIVIEQSGTAATLTDTAVVRTPAMDAGNVDWVPYDEFPTAEIGVIENGTYKASDRGVYAFTKVDVNVPATTVVGKKNGVTYIVTVDSGGNLVWTPEV